MGVNEMLGSAIQQFLAVQAAQQREKPARLLMYTKVVPDGVAWPDCPWVPWINVKASDLGEPFQMLVIHNWVRRRGGMGRCESLKVTLYYYDDDTAAKFENGNPMHCQSVEFTIKGKCAA